MRFNPKGGNYRAWEVGLATMAEFIYTLQKARKAHGDKVVLDDVTLAFLPGAKIGVVEIGRAHV